MAQMKPSKGEYVRINVRVEKRVADALDGIAASLGVKRATLLRMLLLNYIATLQRPPQPQPMPPGLWGMGLPGGLNRPDEGQLQHLQAASAAGVRADGG